MSQQVTITIPDALAERLKAVKQRFNVSGVCQDAIEREVTKQEFYMKEPKDMEQIMKRLRAEKQAFVKQMRDMGREHGLEAATNMDYADLLAVGEVAESQGDITSAALWGNWLEDSVKETESEAHENGEAFDREPYLEGWIEGVMEFWQKVKDKL